MSAIVTSDLHWNEAKTDRHRHDEFVERLATIIKGRADELLVLGDITEHKDNHSAWLTNTIVDHFEYLSQLCDVVILRGNHDGYDPEMSFFQFLRRIKNISWISRPTRMTLSCGKCLFLPHTRDYKKEWPGFGFDEFDFILTHNTFEGALGENHRTLRGIPLSVFPKDAQVISGDVHVPQETPPVTYVGAPYRIKFGDDYRPRVLLLDTDEIRSIPVPGPQKRLVELSHDHPSLPDSLHAGDIIKVRVQLEISHVSQWPEIRKNIFDEGKDLGVEIHSVVPVISYMPGDRKAKAEQHEIVLDDIKLVKEFARRKGIDVKLLDMALKMMERA